MPDRSRQDAINAPDTEQLNLIAELLGIRDTVWHRNAYAEIAKDMKVSLGKASRKSSRQDADRTIARLKEASNVC